MARNDGQTDSSKSARLIPRLVGGLVVVLALGMGVVWLTVVRGSDKSGQDLATFTARRGPLTISVVESGTIKARDQVIIKNEVEGRTSIITLVREGTRVKKGELLVELDASTLQDGKIDQEIRVQNAKAAYINAKENLAIVSSKADSDVNEAELAVEFARKDLTKYEQGQYPKDVNEVNKRIALAREELGRAQQTLDWSIRLLAEKYLSETEKASDEIAVKRKKLEVELAEADLKLLQDFTHPRQIRQLQSDVQQAVSALDRARRKADADKRQAQADLTAKEAEYTRQQQKLQKILDQLTKTTDRRAERRTGRLRHQHQRRPGGHVEGAAGGGPAGRRATGADLPARGRLGHGGSQHSRGEPGQGAGRAARHRHGRDAARQAVPGDGGPGRAAARLGGHVPQSRSEGLQDADLPGHGRSGPSLRDDLPGGDHHRAIRRRDLRARPGRDARRGRRAGLRARRQVGRAAQGRDRPGQQSDGPDHQRARGGPGRRARSAAEILRRCGVERRCANRTPPAKEAERVRRSRSAAGSTPPDRAAPAAESCSSGRRPTPGMPPQAARCSRHAGPAGRPDAPGHAESLPGTAEADARKECRKRWK